MNKPGKNLPFLLAVPVFCIADSYAETPTVDDEKPAKIERGADPVTGLKYWQWNQDGFYLRLTQRLPDQTRGYFEARGFDQESSELLAMSCLFQSMAKNTGNDSSGPLISDLSSWYVISGEKRQPLLLREYWQNIWKQRKIPDSARIGFNWSLLPSLLQYDINDYNWGMTSYGLAPGSQFDLHFSWTVNGRTYNGKINDLVCPDDIHPDPPPQ
jgi:hypothetical protein